MTKKSQSASPASGPRRSAGEYQTGLSQTETDLFFDFVFSAVPYGLRPSAAPVQTGAVFFGEREGVLRPDVRRERGVGDDAVHLRDCADAEGGGLPEFGAVAKKDLFCGGAQDRPADLGLLRGVILNHAVRTERRGREEGDVHAEIGRTADRLIPHERQRGAQELPAGAPHLRRAIRQLLRHAQTVGDNHQLLAGTDASGNIGGGCGGIDEDCPAVSDQACGGMADEHFLMRFGGGTERHRCVDPLIPQDHAAVAPHDIACRLQTGEVAPDGRLAGVKCGAEALHAGIFVLFQNGKNLILPFGFVHFLAPSPAKM